MAKFGLIQTDEVIFKDDKVRLDVSRSFVTPDEDQDLTIEVKPSGSEDFIEIDSDMGFLDWIYQTSGDHVITVKITNTDGNESFDKTISVLDLEDEILFSSDSDLIPYEPTVLEQMPRKWSSFNTIHYKVKKDILRAIKDKQLLPDDEITEGNLVDKTEVKDLACFLALNYIYSGSIVQDGDYFSIKAREYRERAVNAGNQLKVRLDTDNDGDTDQTSTPFSTRISRV